MKRSHPHRIRHRMEIECETEVEEALARRLLTLDGSHLIDNEPGRDTLERYVRRCRASAHKIYNFLVKPPKSAKDVLCKCVSKI